MTDSENKESKSKVLGLKGGTNTVRQSFSHGRSKSVVVETRKKKLLISKKGPVVEEDEKNSVAKIESNENDEILRRKKAIEASKAEEKKLLEQKQTIESQKSTDKATKPIEVLDKINNTENINLDVPESVGSKKKNKKRD